MSVDKVDFGKGPRDTARMFARLLGLCETRAADILARPEYYIEKAYEEVFQLRCQIYKAQEALMPPLQYMELEEQIIRCSMETIVIEKSEYDRLLKCARIIENIP